MIYFVMNLVGESDLFLLTLRYVIEVCYGTLHPINTVYPPAGLLVLPNTTCLVTYTHGILFVMCSK